MEPASTRWEKYRVVPHYLQDWISVMMIANVSDSMLATTTKGLKHCMHGQPSNPTVATVSKPLLGTTADYTVAFPHGPPRKQWIVMTLV